MRQDWMNGLQYAALGASLGVTIAGSLLAGLFLGRALDARFGTGTVLTFAGSFVGLGAGLRYLFTTAATIGKKKAK